MEVGEEGEYKHIATVTTRMACVKMGSNESHINVSLIEEQSHKTVSTNHNF